MSEYEKTDTAVDDFRAGYYECRSIIVGRLRELVTRRSGHRLALQDLLAQLEAEETEQHWQAVQEEFPGITREEYEAELDKTSKWIRERYYRADGQLKLRLVKPEGASNNLPEGPGTSGEGDGP